MVLYCERWPLVWTCLLDGVGAHTANLKIVHRFAQSRLKYVFLFCSLFPVCSANTDNLRWISLFIQILFHLSAPSNACVDIFFLSLSDRPIYVQWAFSGTPNGKRLNICVRMNHRLAIIFISIRFMCPNHLSSFVTLCYCLWNELMWDENCGQSNAPRGNDVRTGNHFVQYLWWPRVGGVKPTLNDNSVLPNWCECSDNDRPTNFQFNSVIFPVSIWLHRLCNGLLFPRTRNEEFRREICKSLHQMAKPNEFSIYETFVAMQKKSFDRNNIHTNSTKNANQK